AGVDERRRRQGVQFRGRRLAEPDCADLPPLLVRPTVRGNGEGGAEGGRQLRRDDRPGRRRRRQAEPSDQVAAAVQLLQRRGELDVLAGAERLGQLEDDLVILALLRVDGPCGLRVAVDGVLRCPVCL